MEDVQNILADIDAVQLGSSDAVAVLTKIVSTRLKRLPMFIIDMPVGEGLVRSRRLEDDENFHQAITDYSYNPDPNHIKIGRANLPGQQIFYASRNRITSLGEVRFIYSNREKKFTRYSLGRWDVRDRVHLAAIVDPDTLYEKELGELHGLADYINKMMLKLRNNSDLAETEAVYRYMARKFVEPVQEGQEDNYKVTAVFSNFVYTKLGQADGILYQSVQYPKHFNVALRREVLDDRRIELVFAARQKFERVEGLNYAEVGSIETNAIDYARGTVIWE